MNASKVTLSASDKIGLISNMATMLGAGISILDIVDSLLEDAKGPQKIILTTLKEDINQGLTIHASFEKFPKVFDKVTVNIVRAAEEAGTLDTALKDLQGNIKREQEFLDKVKGAFVYPTLIMVVFLGVMILILTFVVPRIATVFSRMNSQLPLPTQILIFMSNLLLKQTLLILIIIAVMITAFVMLYRSNKHLVLNFFFSLPLISQLAKEVDLTRFTRSMYLLLSSGIPIVNALDLAGAVMMKNEMKKVVKKAQETVLSGRPFSEALKAEKKLIPRMMLKITEAGEKSGSLDKSMQDISEYLDHEVSNTLNTLTTIIEPLMLVVVGVMIGAMMLSIVAPIYGLIGQVAH